MGKMIDNLRWKPMWISHLGCVKGCLDYLGLDVSAAWLFGATGHAFILNVHEVVCPSGPTAWNTEMIKKLGENIGYSTDMIMAWKSDNDFKEKRKIAWEKTRMALDEGLPCYGWEMDIPEFRPEGGETLIEVQERARQFLQEVNTAYSDLSVVVCSHGDFLRMLISILKNISILEANDIHLDNATYSLFSGKDGQWHCEGINLKE